MGRGHWDSGAGLWVEMALFGPWIEVIIWMIEDHQNFS